MFPESFSTARLHAERLVSQHFDALRAMDGDAAYMARLGGTRTESQTREYLTRNLKHWDQYNCGLWMLRDLDGAIAGRCVLRHLDVEGTDEVELGYGLHARYWGKGLATEVAKELLRLGRTALARDTLVAVTRGITVVQVSGEGPFGITYVKDSDDPRKAQASGN